MGATPAKKMNGNYWLTNRHTYNVPTDRPTDDRQTDRNKAICLPFFKVVA